MQTQNGCLNVGHNFQVAHIEGEIHGDKAVAVIFCTKCGETRPLEITEKG